MDNFYKDTPDFKFHLEHPIVEKIVRLKERNFKESEQYDYAPLNHEDAIDTYDKILDIVGEICAETIAPNAEDVDLEGPHLVDNEVIYAKGTDADYKALYEAGLIGMIGGFVGIAFGFGASKGVELVIVKGFGFELLKVRFNTILMFLVFMFSIIFGALAGAFPARQASHQKPVDALRYKLFRHHIKDSGNYVLVFKNQKELQGYFKQN